VCYDAFDHLAVMAELCCLSVIEMFFSCLVIATVAALYEGLKIVRDSLLRKAWSVSCNGDVLAVPTTDMPTVETVKMPNKCCRQVIFCLKTCDIRHICTVPE